MAASIQDLRNWFRHGAASGHKYMVVLCDTYDWEDYARYANSEEGAREIVNNPGDMTRVMEVYDLEASMDLQMAQTRTWCL